jgi:Asp-tRNA(Asn)/Glu-tRNA(Gln) amidotransferase A subunit family amidase
MELHALTIEEAQRLLKSKDISSVELTRAVLGRISAVEGKVDAFITVAEQTAMEQAKDADQRIASGSQRHAGRKFLKILIRRMMRPSSRNLEKPGPSLSAN